MCDVDNPTILSSRLPVPRDMVVLEESEPQTDSEDSKIELVVSSGDSEDCGKTREDLLNSIIGATLTRLESRWAGSTHKARPGSPRDWTTSSHSLKPRT